MNPSSKSLPKGIAIGGIKGGSGKTVFAIGLIQALIRKGLSVSPFKKGPDYIDPAWLTLASGRQCRNLDAYLMAKDTITSSYLGGSEDADFAVIEGNRGVFDGLDIEGTYSFAELVKWLNIPLILVMDCSKSSRTMAAVVRGCETFDKNLPLMGVVLNQIAGDRHEKIVTDSIKKYCHTPVLGTLPRLSGLPLRERHLGLIPVSEHPYPSLVINALGDAVENNVDIESIIKIAGTSLEKHDITSLQSSRTNTINRDTSSSTEKSQSKGHGSEKNEIIMGPAIGVIKDSAFNFYYTENLEALKKGGGRIIEVNSISDADVPPVDALYIGGGFPETHVELLSKNNIFRENLRKRINDGLPVYAECGGLIYLSDSIIINNDRFPMTGIFPFVFELSDKPVGHGYTLFEVDKQNPFYQIGAVVRGHEFRYSRIINSGVLDEVNTVFLMRKGTGIANGRDGILHNKCLATFSHTHAYSENIQWIDSMLQLPAFGKN